MSNSDTQSSVLFGEELLRHRCNRAMVIICCLMLIGVIVISRTDILLSSDVGPEISSFIGGHNFVEHGFVKLRFLGVHYLGTPSDTPAYYLHYPPLAEILNGFFQAIGIRDLAMLRVVHGCLFIIGTVFLYAAFGPIISYLAALCGVSVLATTTLFLEYSTSIHTHAYNMLYLGMFFFFFFRGLRRENSTKEWVACWLVLFLNSLTSFEFILYPFVFALIYILVDGKIGKYWRILFILGLAPVAGVGLHFLQNCWAIGWSGAFEDKMGFGKSGGGLNRSDFYAILKLPSEVMRASMRQLHIGWSSLLILSGVFLGLRRQVFPQKGSNIPGFMLGILTATGSWYMFMPEFVISHRCCSDQLVPLYVVVIGVSVSIILKSLTINISSKTGKIIAASGFILMILLYQSYYLKPRLINKRSPAQRLPRVIGPDALPADAGYVCNEGISWSFRFFCKRPSTQLSKGQSLNQDFLSLTQKYFADDSLFRYFLYYGKGASTKDPLFQELAGQFTGKAKEFRCPTDGKPARLILFDISSLTDREGTHSPIDPEVKSLQIKGTFAEWEIPGFDERLAAEYGLDKP